MSNKYLKIIALGPQLCLAFQDNLTSLTDLFLSVDLISEDNRDAVTNESRSVQERTAELFYFITMKVELGDDNYDAFVEVLQRDQSAHCKQILKIRESFVPDFTRIIIGGAFNTRNDLQ